MIKGQFGRADLLMVLAQLDREQLYETAGLAGYKKKAVSKEAVADNTQAESTASEPDRPAEQRSWAPVPFWRVVAQKSIQPASEVSAQQPRSAAAPGWTKRPAPVKTISTVSRADAARLMDFLTVPAESKTPDIAQLTDRIARGEPALPIRYRKSAARPNICLLIDRSRRLVPFWQWQDDWVAQLWGAMDAAGIDVAVCSDESPPQPLVGEQTNWSIREADAVLLLGDAGLTGGRQCRAWWRHLRSAVLAPQCAAWQLSPIALPQAFYSGWKRLPAPAGAESREHELTDALDLLFTLTSVAVRVEPGLLSELRELIGAPAALEAWYWRHSNLSSNSSVAATLSREALQRYRREFNALCEDPERRELATAALSIIRRWRAELPPEIWFEEILSLPAQSQAMLREPQDFDDAREFVTNLAATGAGHPGGYAHEWLKRVFDRNTDIGAQPPAVQQALSQLWRAAHPHGDQPPSGYRPPESPQLPENRWQISVGSTEDGRLQISERAIVDEQSGHQRCDIAQIRKRGNETVVQCDGKPAQILGGKPAVADSVQDLLIRTDCEEIRLRATTKPDWASAIGCDRFGLWVEICVEASDESTQQMVVQRMRWIAPGEFWLGSPNDEPGRRDDEGPQHRVRLTTGFWMFDTPVTQALWQAVMGSNPSRFVSRTRPVEQVSFEDAQAFLLAINSRYPGLQLSLPTEAQWEYACRAGTEEATYAGPIDIVSEDYAPVLNDIAWYAGNSSDGFELDNGYDWSDDGERAGSHPVARKHPNQWGLHDMLGNVLEWCDSGWGEYGEEYEEDPPGGEASSRVVRGGSWNLNARYVRAAYRIHFEPGDRNYFLGFRCLRVQQRE